MLRVPTLIAILVVVGSGPVASHEFWIDPESFDVAPGEQIVAALRVGQAFKGTSQSYLPPRFRRFDYVSDGAVAEVPGRIGDRPAVSMPAPGDGLLTLVHVTTDTILTYTQFEKFEAFVTHKDATFAIDDHRARGLPDAGFREVYSRYAKSLIAVGDGAGADSEIGLETEIVALENPYTGDMDDGIDVRVLYQGQPRGDAQVEVFEKAPDDSVTVTTTRTDADGIATVPVRAGYRYQLDAVVIREPSADVAEARDAVWESLWANLTFGVPEG